MCLGECGGQFLERNVRFGLHDLKQKLPMRCEFAKLTSGAALQLGKRSAMVSMLCCKPNRRRRAHPEKPPCRPGRVSLGNVCANPFPKV
jgi:hypothetical protein